MPEELKRQAAEFLKQKSFCSIATVSGDQPNCATVTYAEDGLEIYLATSRDSQKFKNLEENPNCALVINDQGNPSEAGEKLMQIKGIQYIGKAEILEEKEKIEHAFGVLMRKHPWMEKMKEQMSPEKTGIIKIVPQKVFFLDYEKGFGHREEIKL